MSAPEPGGNPEMTRTGFDGYGWAATVPATNASTATNVLMRLSSTDALEYVQAAHAVEEIDQSAIVHGDVVALHAVGPRRHVRHVMRHLPQRVRARDVDDAQSVREPGDRDLGAGHFLARLVAAGHARL